ncbi:hypothetical protein STEG23_015148 [Scotinomys teguina]
MSVLCWGTTFDKSLKLRSTSEAKDAMNITTYVSMHAYEGSGVWWYKGQFYGWTLIWPFFNEGEGTMKATMVPHLTSVS